MQAEWGQWYLILELFMKAELKKVTSKWIVTVGEEHFEFDNLADAEKKLERVIRAELDGYLIRKDYSGNKLIEEMFIG